MSDLERTRARFMHLPDAKVPCSITLSVPKGKSCLTNDSGERIKNHCTSVITGSSRREVGMGVCWDVYCPRHMEVFGLEKWWRESDIGPLPADINRRLTSRLKDCEYEDVFERELDRRYTALVKAFIHRHHGCELMVTCDASDEYGKAGWIEAGSGWDGFDIWEDVKMDNLNCRIQVESYDRRIDQLGQEVQNVERKLEGRGGLEKRRRLENKRSGLLERIHEVERARQTYLRRKSDQAYPSPIVDLFEVFRTKPLN